LSVVPVILKVDVHIKHLHIKDSSMKCVLIACFCDVRSVQLF